ncbi:PAS domain-containing sensor histidine kinase [Niveispirillum sp.]|uniref:sensor histidine kinase n=1 Tax=Niveispirillum sp. TaxID=1917217 RepID=UPI001B662316|nr:PAS domain-containing sensor histidine kinase [Niveispirillum sp.]MBP7336375.1 PAS domain-containing sensor histidine kinase [Niveispirillum sp.]
MVAPDTTGEQISAGSLTEADRLFTSYFNSTSQVLVLLDGDGTVRAANRAALRVGDLALSQVLGLALWETPWWRGAAGVRERLTSAVQAAGQGATIRFDAATGPETGAPLVFDVSITPIDPGPDGAIRLMAEARDVTEARDIEQALRTNEQRLRDMVEGSVQGIVVHSGRRILFCNPAYAQMLGYGSVLDVLSMDLDIIIPEPGREQANRAWSILLAGGKLPIIRSAPNVCRDGSLIHVDVLARRIVWDGQYAIQATVVDVTAQAKAAAAEAARLAAEEASRTKSAFIATMSHELRTPLNAILGFAGMIASADRDGIPADPRHIEYAGDITVAARHLLSVINDMLHLSKIEAGRLTLEPCWIPLEGELRQIQRIAQGLAQEKRLSIHVDLPIGEPLLLLADERALRQLLLNIVGNAVKFTPAGGDIWLAADLDRGDGRLVLSVADTGVGIPDGDLERIWRPFEQVGRVQDHQNGTGLGLSIARALAELHGATVSVDSRLGHGTTFRFRFPADHVARGTAPRQTASNDQARDTAAIRAGR